MKKLVVVAAFLGVMPATLHLIQVRGRPGETCYVLVDARNAPVAVRCSRPALET